MNIEVVSYYAYSVLWGGEETPNYSIVNPSGRLAFKTNSDVIRGSTLL